MTYKKSNKKGYTLTELIVVIVIIGILAAVLIPSITGYVGKAKDSACEQEATAYVTAHKTWMAEKDELKGEEATDFSKYLVLLEIIVPANASLAVNESWENGFIYTSPNGRKATYTVGSPLVISE